MGQLDKAIAVWSNIRRDENPKVYAKAQFSLGNTYEDIGNLGEATTAWSNIRPEDDPEIYFEAQLNL